MARKEFGQPNRPKLIGRLSEDNLFYSESGELIGTYKITKEWTIHRTNKQLIQVLVILENGQEYNGTVVKGNTIFKSLEMNKEDIDTYTL